MKQLISQILLMPDRSGKSVHRQKKSVTKGLVEVAGSVFFLQLMINQERDLSGVCTHPYIKLQELFL